MHHSTGHLQRVQLKHRTLITIVNTKRYNESTGVKIFVSLTFDVNYLLIKTWNIIFVSAKRPLGYNHGLMSVIMTVRCLTWLLVMYFAPKYMIRLSVDYRQDSKIPIRLKILSRGQYCPHLCLYIACQSEGKLCTSHKPRIGLGCRTKRLNYSKRTNVKSAHWIDCSITNIICAWWRPAG